jgi:hypothetical protein
MDRTFTVLRVGPKFLVRELDIRTLLVMVCTAMSMVSLGTFNRLRWMGLRLGRILVVRILETIIHFRALLLRQDGHR